MATSTEELLVRMGFDGSAVSKGTDAMLAQQRKAADSYVGFWEGALEKQAAAETKANDASLARLKANLAAKERATTEFFAAQAAQYDIAAGYVPENMGGGIKRNAAGDIISGAGEGVGIAAGIGGAKALARGIGGAAEREGGTAASREVFVVIREFFRNASVSRILSSLMRLLSLLMDIPLTIPAVIIGSVAAIGQFVPKLWGGANISGTYQAYKQKGAAGSALESKLKSTAEMLRKRISAAQSAGLLSANEAGYLHGWLNNPTDQNVLAVMNATRGMTGQMAVMSATTEKNREHQIELKNFRETLHGQDRLTFDLLQQKIIQEQISHLKKGDKDANSLAISQLENQRAVNQDLAEIERQKTSEKNKQAEAQKKLAAEQARANISAERSAINASLQEKEYPTIEALAGRSFVERLNRGYGRGGIYDLERGNNPYTKIAQDYLWAQKQQMWDISYGNKGAAEQDRLRMIRDRTKLTDLGVSSPEQKLAEIGDNTAKLHSLFLSLKKSGALMTTIIANDS